MGNFEKSIEHFKTYASLSPGDANPLDSLAEACFRMGRPEEAIATFKEALDIKPDFFSSIFNVGYIYALKEDYPEAMKWVDKFIAMAPSPGTKRAGYLFKAFYRYWLGSLEEFNFYLREAEKSSAPGNVWGLPFMNWVKAFIYYDRGELEQSRRHNEAWLDNFTKIYPQRKLHYQGVYNFLWGLLELKAGHIDSAKNKLAEMKSLIKKMPPMAERMGVILY